VLAEHESAEQRLGDHLTAGEDPQAPVARQLTIFTPLSQGVVERLRGTNLDQLSPLEALQLLYELKKEIE
jgi:DNA mismatch repair protein MutS